MLLKNQNPDYELEIHREVKTSSLENEYDLSRNQLIEILGDLENVKNLLLLGDFLESQEFPE